MVFEDEFGKNSFYHYTRLGTMDKILESGKLRACIYEGVNSLNDKNENLEQGRDAVFCFCTTATGDRLPMWYLYSGITGRGSALKFKPNQMRKLIENIKKNGLTCTFKDGSTSLLHYEPKNEQYSDFILQYGRVIYKTHTDKKESNYKWKGKVYHLIEKDEIAELKNKLASLFQDVQSSSKLSCKEFEDFEKTPFFKDYPWEYENEFRVLINLNKKYLNKVKYIEVDISSFMKDLKVHFGPNLKEKDLEVVELPNIKKYWIENRDKHLISSIQADMNIMKIHKEEIIEYYKREREEFCDLLHALNNQ